MKIVDLAPIQARQILARSIKEWGKKNDYFATPEEFKILVRAGAVINKLNHNNGDGTLTHSLSYGGKVFTAVTRYQLTL